MSGLPTSKSAAVGGAGADAIYKQCADAKTLALTLALTLTLSLSLSLSLSLTLTIVLALTTNPDHEP